jgi:phosphate-selective porin OprO/OprP
VPLLVTAIALPAAAQTPPPFEGFLVQTPDGSYRLQLGAVIQTDGRFPLDEPSPVLKTFVLRKARPVLAGRIARYFDFRIMPELAGSVTVLDAYFDIRFSPTFRLRSGKDKTPIGYELLLSDPTLVFPERSVVSLLVPSRDIGFQALGEIAGGRVLYSGGVFNGNPTDGGSSTTDTDVNDGKDVAGRLVYMPFRTTKGSRLANFGVHLGASRGSQDGALPSFRTSIGQTLFNYATGAAANGDRTRVTPAVFLYSGRLGAFAEYARSSAEVARNGVVTTVAHQAWDVTATFVLTGEPTSERGVQPRQPFDPAAGQWGALQLTGRVGELRADRDAFDAGLAGAGAVRRARQVTVGVNWFLNNYVKVYGTFERFTFDGARDAENSIVFRTQLAF